jgi:hypothetical protein
LIFSFSKAQPKPNHLPICPFPDISITLLTQSTLHIPKHFRTSFKSVTSARDRGNSYTTIFLRTYYGLICTKNALKTWFEASRLGFHFTIITFCHYFELSSLFHYFITIFEFLAQNLQYFSKNFEISKKNQKIYHFQP